MAIVRDLLLAATLAAAARALPTPAAVGLRGAAPSPDLPLSDPRLRAVSTVEQVAVRSYPLSTNSWLNFSDKLIVSLLQVHITAGSTPSSVFVTWVTNVSESTTIRYKEGDGAEDERMWSSFKGPPGQVYSSLMDPRFPKAEGGCIGSKNYTNPYCFYTSGEIHSVELTDLKPATKYTYSVGSATKQFSFKTAPAVGPKAGLKLAIVGDLGQVCHTVPYPPTQN